MGKLFGTDGIRGRANAYPVVPEVALQLGKEAVNAAFEMPLAAGVLHERRLFYLLFGTHDQKEGMAAFVEKRKAEWKGE